MAAITVLDAPRSSGYCGSMSRSQKVEYAAPPALTHWQEQEAKWRVESQQWVKSTLLAYFKTPAADIARTSAEIMLEILDIDSTMPEAYARLMVKNRYDERFHLVRNTLETIARSKACVIGSTLNKSGREASTYARPQNAVDDWSIVVQTTDKGAEGRALHGIKEWLSLEGAVLRNVTGVMLIRKAGGTETNETTNTAADKSAGNQGRASARGTRRINRRKPRDTEGGD